MPAEIDEALVRHIAHLSRLRMDEAEVSGMARELSTIVAYVDQLRELNTDDVPPTAHALPVRNVFRDDVIAPSLEPERALANAPQRERGFFRVPKVLEHGGGA